MTKTPQLDNSQSSANKLIAINPVEEAESDKRLFMDIARGDVRAFEELYDRYSGLLYAVCMRVLRQEFEAREVLSEVFMDVWQRAFRFDPSRGTVQTFLVVLATSRSVDRLRKDSSRKKRFADSPFGLESEVSQRKSALLPDDQAIVREESLIVRSALENLSSQQKRVIEAAYFDGMSHQEIAEHLELPLGTVKTCIRRGIDTLKNALRRTTSELEDPRK